MLTLGMLFLAIQVYTLHFLATSNLLPGVGGGEAALSVRLGPGRGLHSSPDVYYLSAVGQRLAELNAEFIESGNQPEAKHIETRAQRTMVVDHLSRDASEWTADLVARHSPDSRSALMTLASDVWPIELFRDSANEFRRGETESLSKQLQQLAEDSERMQSAQRDALSDMQAARADQQRLEEKLASSTDEANVSSLRSELASAQKAVREAATAATEAQDELRRASDQRSRVSSRLDYLTEIHQNEVGMNARYPWLGLPVCIPNGWRWVVAYLVVTCCHMVHVVFGLVEAWGELRKSDSGTAEAPNHSSARNSRELEKRRLIERRRHPERHWVVIASSWVAFVLMWQLG
ncbi:MAG TPA: hypothetical protein DDW52_07020 [Planctomycetaceae bacterium]|nr:hypothetical protein [Planctomycetaceae bacterium]